MVKKFLLIAICVVGLQSCGGGNGGSGDDPRIRFIHAAPNSPPISLLVDGALVGTQVYAGVSGYSEAGEGAASVEGRSGNDMLFSGSARFEDNNEYSIVAVNPSAGAAPFLVVPDDNDTADPDKFRIRALHVVPGGTPVDVYVLRENVPLTGQTPTFNGLTYGQQSGYDQIDRNEYIVYVTPIGSQQILASASADFGREDVWTAIIMADAPPAGLRLVLSRDRNGSL